MPVAAAAAKAKIHLSRFARRRVMCGGCGVENVIFGAPGYGNDLHPLLRRHFNFTKKHVIGSFPRETSSFSSSFLLDATGDDGVPMPCWLPKHFAMLQLPR